MNCHTAECPNPGEYVVRDFDGYDRWVFRWRCEACVLEVHRTETEKYLNACEELARTDRTRAQAAAKLTPEEREAVGL